MSKPDDDHEVAGKNGMRVSAFWVGHLELVVASHPKAPQRMLEQLSTAEQSVAVLASRGLKNREIAHRRHSAERTVANQLAAVFRKLGVGSRAELALLLATGSLRGSEGLVGNDGERAREVWLALADGRWTVVDFFDDGERSFVLATKNAPPIPTHRGLSPRERQVVEQVAAGHPNKLIAAELGIAEGAVASTLSNAMQKLGVRSRAEVARLAVFVNVAV